MTVVTLVPNGTTSISGAVVTGAANAHSALSDSSDSSYVTFAGSGTDQVILTFADLSLPAGAVITSLRPQVRDKNDGSGGWAYGTIKLLASAQRGPDGSSPSSWTTFTDHVYASYTAASLSDVSDSDVDAASIDLSGSTGLAGLIVSKLSLLVTYVAKPVCDVTAPTGTVTSTNTPTVQWSNTLDSDGGTQTKYEVKIFSAAQYGAGGFDPSSSTPTETSGIASGAATSWTPADPLPDATYRAYVRVGQTVLGQTHWSDWDFLGFTIAASTPGQPVPSAVAEDDEGRIWITVDDTPGAGATHAFEVQRSIDGGSTWETIRTTDGGLIMASGGLGRAYDYEVGNGVTVTYRARALNIGSFTTYSAWSLLTLPTAWQSSSWWLKSPLHPDLNIPVEVDGMESLEQDARQGVFDALGRRLSIVVSDVRSGFRGTVRFVCDDATERADVDELLDLCEPLLLQAPPTDHWDDRYIMLGSLSRGRGTDKAYVGWTIDGLSWVEVEAPADDVVAWPAFAS